MNQNSPNPASSRCRNTLGLILLTLAALVVRLLYLGRAELWSDEILFVLRDGYPGAALADIYRHMLSGFSTVTHLPFPLMAHNLLLRFLTTVVFPSGLNGLNPFWFRFPAALWGTATVPLLYLLLRRRLPQSVVWLATAWLAVGFFPVFYSREAYFYAPLMALSTLTLHFWLQGIESLSSRKRMPPGSSLGLVLSGTAMVHSHLTGMVFQAALCLAAGLASILPRQSGWRVPGAWKLTVLSLLPLLAAAPFFQVWLTESVQAGMAPGTPVVLILWDVAGKFFLGNLPPLNAIGLALMLLGAAGLFRAGSPARPAARWMAGLGTGVFVILLCSSHWTAYMARYFCVLIPLMLTANACGISLAARFAGRLPLLRSFRHATVFRILAFATLALNLLILPLLWLPTSRARNYGAIADWLNEHVPSGGAYLWESAYETRFVSEESDAPFRTPDRLAMRPLIHHDPEELDTVRRLQRDLLERYPEIPWIDCRHGQRPGMEYGDWEWPRTFFHRFALIETQSFRWQDRLRLGIHPLGRVPDSEKSIPIWFNDPSDQLSIDSQAERAASLFYPGWRFEPTRGDGIFQEYARVHPAPVAPIQAVPLGDTEQTVIFRARIAVTAGPATIPADLELRNSSTVIARWELTSIPAFHDIQSPPFRLPAEDAILELQATTDTPGGPTRIWLERAELTPP